MRGRWTPEVSAPAERITAVWTRVVVTPRAAEESAAERGGRNRPGRRSRRQKRAGGRLSRPNQGTRLRDRRRARRKMYQRGEVPDREERPLRQRPIVENEEKPG